MQRIIDLIEQTLDADVTPQELADAAGYSRWHFLHLFRDTVGMPLCRWRTRRRLQHAIWHVSMGMGVTEAALRWGFETHSGFYRAFQREYGCTPAAYLRTHQVRMPAPPQLKEENYRMLTRERFREALAHWGLELPLTPITYPHSGEICDNAMYAGADYVLKACRDEGACSLAAAAADAMAVHGIPAATAVPLPEGGLSVPVCGFRMMLQRRIPGTPMRTTVILRHPGTSGEAIGRALAALHLALAELDAAALADDMDLTGHLIEWAWPRAEKVLPEGFPADFPARAAALRMLPHCVIHRDPNPSNLIIAEDGVGFTDFELSVRACRLFDPCYTATAVLSECFGRDELSWQAAWPIFTKSLLTGYDAASPLTADEWQAAPTLMLGNVLLALAAFADSSKYQHVFQTNRRMLGWMLEHMPV